MGYGKRSGSPYGRNIRTRGSGGSGFGSGNDRKAKAKKRRSFGEAEVEISYQAHHGNVGMFGVDTGVTDKSREDIKREYEERLESEGWEDIKVEVADAKAKDNSGLADSVEDKVKEYAEKLGLKSPVKIKFDNSARRMARLRANSEGITVEINKSQLEKLEKADVSLTKEYLDYAIAHELAHAKQVETYGLKTAAAMPRWLIEEKADQEAAKVLGKTEEDIGRVVSLLNQKMQSQNSLR